MNFCLIMCGYRFKNFDDCIKFISHSASQSDYVVSVEGFRRLTPFSSYCNRVTLTGSLKKIYNNIVLDMDNIVSKSPLGNIFISPKILGLPTAENGSHYWGVLGALLKIVGDISPAYVTGFLIENNMKKELDIFTAFYTSLPSTLQAAVTDLTNKENN